MNTKAFIKANTMWAVNSIIKTVLIGVLIITIVQMNELSQLITSSLN